MPGAGESVRSTLGSAVSAVGGVGGVVREAAARLGAAAGQRSSGAQQTLTVGRPADDVAALWRDPVRMAQVLGDAGTVDVELDRWTWHLTTPGAAAGKGEPVEWRTTLADGGIPRVLRWSSSDGDSEDGGQDEASAGSASELVVTLREAPQDLGTEVTVRLDLPVPDLAAGALALTLGYRARALLLTGEVPTTTPQPSGRQGDR